MIVPSRSSGLPHELSEEVVRRLVQVFYARARSDLVLGPIFEKHVGHRWEAHLSALVDFWSSVALMSGRYSGKPHLAHVFLGLVPEDFEQWLRLFEETVSEVCQGRTATFLMDRAHRIADSLQIGLGIGSKALRLPAKTFADAP